MELNIYNPTPRFVEVKYNMDGLKKGQKYWLERVEIHPFKTEIYLEGRKYPINSVHLEEAGIFAQIGEKNINRIAIIDVPKDIIIELCGYFRERITKEEMQSLKKGEFISIGKNSDNNHIVGESYNVVSHYHCLVYNDGRALVVLDCSTNGTSIVI